MENNTNTSKLLSNESSFTENSVNTSYWYTDEDIYDLLKVRVRDLGEFAVNKTFLLQGVGSNNDYPEIGEEKRYQVFITQAVDNQNLLFFFDREQQGAPEPGRRDERQDIFAELAPLLAVPMANIKILFPYNNGVHWLLGEIKLCKINNEFTINFYLHDPYGAGQWNFDNYQLLRQCFEHKFYTLHPDANVRVNNSPSHYISGRQNSKDTVSCGVIVVEDLIKRIAGNSLNIDRPYPIGAKELREQHIRQLENFYRREPNNPTLVNFKRRTIQQSFESNTQSNQPSFMIANNNYVPQNFIQSPSLSLNSTLQNNVTNHKLQTNNNAKQQVISQTNTQTVSSVVDQKLKARLLNRCNLIITATEELIKQLERTKLADEASNNELLKRSLIKYFTKNILGKTKTLQDNLCVLQDGVVARDLGDQMRSILTYIERFNKKRLETGTCKKNVNHYEFLLASARDFLTRELNKLADLAILNPPRPEEIEMDPVVNEQAIILQQQQKDAIQDSTFQLALKNVCTWARQRHAEVSVFISYAWSSEHRPWEQWVQPFLQTLKLQLELAGILVYMDIYDSRYGFNSYHHMNRIESCHHVIVIGTESLLDKFQRGVSAVCYELNEIRKRREQDTQAKRFSVIPLIINGTMRTSLPSEYERFTVIESFLGGSYVQTVKALLAKLYNLSSEHPDFVEAWQPCAALIAQQTQSPIANIEQPKTDMSDEFASISTAVIPHSATHSNYLNKLKTVYQDKAFSGVKCLFNDEVMAIEDYYVNLALIKETEQKRKEEAHHNPSETNISLENVMVRDEATELFSRAEQFFNVQESIELKDIFKPLENDSSKQTSTKTNRLLIIGSAGIGKTTLCQYIANQWAQGKLWADRYHGIFRIPLRNLIASRYTATRDYSLLEIINKECFADRLVENEQKHLDSELKNHPERYLVILDGYDELSDQVADEYLVTQTLTLMQHPEVIVTSRPQPLKFAADKKLEILGFTEENIERYTANFFRNQQDKSEKLQQQLQQQSFLKSLAHIPINLELICSAWQSQGWSEEQSLTDLYQHLVGWLQYRYLNKFHPHYSQARNLQALGNLTLRQKETLCAEWLNALEQIAWQMRQKGSIYVAKNELIADKKEIATTEFFLKQLQESGLLRLTSDKNFYYFAHLTFQEFFAARYAAKVIQNASSQGITDYEAFQTFFKENKFNPKLQVVWWFIAGLLKEDSKALDKYLEILLNYPRELIGYYEIPLIMQIIEQSNLAKNSAFANSLLPKIKDYIFNILVKNLKFLKYLGMRLRSEFSPSDKDENRVFRGICFLVEKLKFCPKLLNFCFLESYIDINILFILEIFTSQHISGNDFYKFFNLEIKNHTNKTGFSTMGWRMVNWSLIELFDEGKKLSKNFENFLCDLAFVYKGKHEEGMKERLEYVSKLLHKRKIKNPLIKFNYIIPLNFSVENDVSKKKCDIESIFDSKESEDNIMKSHNGIKIFIENNPINRSFQLIKYLKKKNTYNEEIKEFWFIYLKNWIETNIYTESKWKEIAYLISPEEARTFVKVMSHFTIFLLNDKNSARFNMELLKCRIVYCGMQVNPVHYMRIMIYKIIKKGTLLINGDDLFYLENGKKVNINFDTSYKLQLIGSAKEILQYKPFSSKTLTKSIYLQSGFLQAIKLGDIHTIYAFLNDNVFLLNTITKNNELLTSYVFQLTIPNAQAIQLIILLYRPFVSLDHLNQVLENDFLLHYKDSRELTEKNFKLIEKTITSLIGTSNVNQKLVNNRLQVLAYALDMNLDAQLHPVRGLFSDDYLIFRLACYLQILGKLITGTINPNQYPNGIDKKPLSKSALIALIKREILLVWEALRLHDEWQCITYLSQDYSKQHITSLWEYHALSLIRKLQALPIGEELIYPTGYEGHCIYIVFKRLKDKIIGRVDNLLEADIQNRHQRDAKGYKPFLLGEWQVNQQLGGSHCSLKRYLTKGLFLAKSRGRSQALELIYLQTLQEDNETLTHWPSLSVQGRDNCVVKGFQLGLLCRSISEDVFKFFEEEHAKLWVSAIINPIPVNNNSSSSPAISSINNFNQRATGLTVENLQNESVLSHDALMDLLAEALNISDREVKFGSTVEQTLVDTAGINVKQMNPIFSRNHQDQSTMFYLNFPNEDAKQQFINFYQRQWPGIILRTIEESGKTRIDFNTPLFVKEIIPVLKLRRADQTNSALPTVYSSPVSQLTHRTTPSNNNNNQPPTITTHVTQTINVETTVEAKEYSCLIL